MSEKLEMCCALSVAVQDKPIFKGKQLSCETCGRLMEYTDTGIGWSYVQRTVNHEQGKDGER